MERIKNLSRALFVALTLCAAVATPSWSQAPPLPDGCGNGEGNLCRDVRTCDYPRGGGSSTCTTEYYYYP